MELTSKDWASDSGHWYTTDGTPAYTIVGANGKERNTTLRDARKLDLYPSVSAIIKMAAAPGLENWKQNQVLMAALTMPRIDGEPESEYISRIMRDSKEQGRKAADRGTVIHGALEDYFSTGRIRQECSEYITGSISAMKPVFGEQYWRAEKSFANALGYGGKVDLHSPEVVIDFKTKEFDAENLPKAYDDNIMQLAAYRRGLGYPYARCANVMVSVTVPGLVHIIEHPEEDLERGLNMFDCLLEFWKVKNKFTPCL